MIPVSAAPPPWDWEAAFARFLFRSSLVLVVGKVIVVAAILLGCRPPAPEKPACSPESLTAIEARFAAEALKRCAGFSYAECPARAELEATNAREREEWNRCR